MIKFTLEPKERIALQKLLTMSLIDILDDSRQFTIFVNDKVFFDDPYFSIREFVRYSIGWLKKPKKNFVYETIDDYQNPLLSFYKVKNGLKITSVWQKFECENIFSHDEVKNFIVSVTNQVIIE